jgi:hypothetical protein
MATTGWSIVTGNSRLPELLRIGLQHAAEDWAAHAGHGDHQGDGVARVS